MVNGLVGISTNVTYLAERNEYRDNLDWRLISWVQSMGFIPYLIPNNLKNPVSIIASAKPKLIILSGGNDIGEYKNRDQTELSLLSYAKRINLPVIGICRGMQLMAKWAGSETKSVTSHAGSRHHIYGKINRLVNSYHNLAIDFCPNEFKILAKSSVDDEIEAIKHVKLPWEGWMWHPEREEEYTKEDSDRVYKLLDL